MVTKKVVLILGAGASIPYGFPTGENLVDQIKNSTFLVKDWNYLKNNSHLATEFIKEISIANPSSIDVFLNNRPKFQEIGKYAITRIILKNKINPLSTSKKEDDWYNYISQQIQKSFTSDDFNKIKLSVITFNYDSSFEDTIFTKLKSGYG